MGVMDGLTYMSAAMSAGPPRATAAGDRVEVRGGGIVDACAREGGLAVRG